MSNDERMSPEAEGKLLKAIDRLHWYIEGHAAEHEMKRERAGYPPRCITCRAEQIGGQPLSISKHSLGKREWIEKQCEICARREAEAMWPEDWGPYPYRIGKEGIA